MKRFNSSLVLFLIGIFAGAVVGIGNTLVQVSVAVAQTDVASAGAEILMRTPATIYTDRMNPVAVERILLRAPAIRPQAETDSGAPVTARDAVTFAVLRLAGHAGATTTPLYLLPDWSAQGLTVEDLALELLPYAALFGPHANVYIVEPRGLVAPDADFACPGALRAPLSRTVSRAELNGLTAAYLQECRTWWQEAGMNLGAYSMDAMAADVAAVAALLGHQEIHAVGIGSGAFVALHLAQRAESPLARALLIRPPGVEYPFVEPTALNELMGALGRRAAVAPTLNGLIPDLVGLLDRVVQRLRAAPVAVTITDPATGQSLVVAVGVDDLHMALGAALSSGEADAVPARLLALELGDFRWLGERAYALRRGMTLDLAATIALCRASPQDDAAVELANQAELSVVGAGPFQVVGEVCSPFADLGSTLGPINFDAISAPLLFVTGQLDGRASALVLNTVATRHLIVDDLLLDNWTGHVDAEFWHVAAPVLLNFLADDFEAIPLLGTPLQFDPPTARPFQLPPWQADYYGNRNLAGDPVLTRTDQTIDFDWRQEAPGPGVMGNEFSVRWAQQVELPAGVYRFHAWSDDGARLWIDNVMVLDAWQEGPLRAYVVDVNLVRGIHDIRYEYFDGTGDALARLRVAYVTDYADWLAEYYPNADLAENPVVVRNEPPPNAFWGATGPAPGIAAGNFSARWTTHAQLEPGAYTFRIVAGGGVRFFLDDELVIDAWENVGRRVLETNRILTGNEPTRLRIEYFVIGGAAELVFAQVRRAAPVGPQVVVEGPARAVAGQSLALTVSVAPEAGRTITGVLWDMGDSIQYTGPNIQHVYNAPGFYDVTVIVTDSGGIATGVSRQVRVDSESVAGDPARGPMAALDGPVLTSADRVARFDAGDSLGQNPILRYRWDFGDGTRSEAAWVEKVYQTPGVYNLRLRVDDEMGFTGTRSQLVMVLPRRVGEPVVFDAISIPGITFDAPGAPPADPVHADPQLAPNAVISGIVGEQAILFQMNEEGALTIDLPPNQPIVLDARASSASEEAALASYLWDIADGFSTATDAVIEVVFSAAGTYRVQLTVTDAQGRSGSRLLLITVTGE